MMHKLLLLFVSCALVVAVDADTVITTSSINLLMSETLPGNLLPGFLFLQGAEEGGSTKIPIGGGRGSPEPFIPPDTCSDDIFEGANPDLRSPQLPYLTQDEWTCDRTPTDVPSLRVETESLVVEVTPQFGGALATALRSLRGGRQYSVQYCGIFFNTC
jgi:hypothetical protein